MIALYPGAFKPPHRGHFNVVKSLLDGSYNGTVYDKDNYKEKGLDILSGTSTNKPSINKVLVFVGGGERNGITKEESLAIWEIYAKHLGNVEILDGQKNPMFASKDYAQANPNDEFVAVTGIRGDQDFVDLRRVTTYKNAPNVQGLALASAPGSGVRATDFRKSILSGNLDDIIDFFPEALSKEEILNILTDLKDKIVAEIIGSNIEGFVEGYFSEENRYNKDGYDEGDIKLMGDYILPIDKMVVLQAEEDTYNRGLLVTNNKDKSYDVAYWADDKTKPYPIGIEIDGKEVAKDANIIKFMFHPEMKETADPQDGKAAPYGSGYKKIKESKSTDIDVLVKNANINNLKNYLGRLIPQGTSIKRDSDRLVVEYSNLKEDETKKLHLKDYITSLTEYMLDKGMKITPLPEVKIRKDEDNASNFFGRTAHYDPNTKEIVLYVTGRHNKDIVRSYSHEMIHHMQNLNGTLGQVNTSNTNEDDHLMELEKQAYLEGNITFRNWEDSLK